MWFGIIVAVIKEHRPNNLLRPQVKLIYCTRTQNHSQNQAWIICLSESIGASSRQKIYMNRAWFQLIIWVSKP